MEFGLIFTESMVVNMTYYGSFCLRKKNLMYGRIVKNCTNSSIGKNTLMISSTILFCAFWIVEFNYSMIKMGFNIFHRNTLQMIRLRKQNSIICDFWLEIGPFSPLKSNQVLLKSMPGYRQI